jgi:FkbM family methyltransferase
MDLKKRLASGLRRATRRLVFKKRLPSDFGGAHVYVTPRSDLRLIYPGYKRSSSDLMLVANRFIRPGDCVWDIGSNLGIFSVCAAYIAGPKGRVFALEADPRYASLQSRTFDSLGSSYAPLRGLCCAVADKVGILDFCVSSRGHARSHLACAATAGQIGNEAQRSVVSVTPDFLLGYWPAPNFVKIDIEGSEDLAISGAKTLLTSVRPILYIEVSGPNKRVVSLALKDVGYRFFKLEHNGCLTHTDTCGLDTIAAPAKHWLVTNDQKSH